MPQEQNRVYLGGWVTRGSEVRLDGLLAFVVILFFPNVIVQPVLNQGWHLIEALNLSNNWAYRCFRLYLEGFFGEDFASVAPC